MVIDDPEDNVTEKLLASTVIDSRTALDPVIFRVYPATEIIVSVLRVVVLNAAKLTLGKSGKRIDNKIVMTDSFIFIFTFNLTYKM